MIATNGEEGVAQRLMKWIAEGRGEKMPTELSDAPRSTTRKAQRKRKAKNKMARASRKKNRR